MKPTVGMSFDSIMEVEEFYKEYAHEGGFSVRIGSQNVLFGEIMNKRFLCSRNGFKKKEGTSDPSKKERVKWRQDVVVTRIYMSSWVRIRSTTSPLWWSNIIIHYARRTRHHFFDPTVQSIKGSRTLYLHATKQV